MLGGLVVVLILLLVSFAVIDKVASKYPFVNRAFLRNLSFYHIGLSLAYYGYALFNPSDSTHYHSRILLDFRGPNWSDYYGTSTIFIEFVGYPFIKYLGFSYEASMALFSFFGFLGFVFFYIFFKENIRFNHQYLGVDLLTLIFFLPNLHFWSSSLGKGSIIFLGIGLFFFGISRIKTRIVAIIIGGLIIYHVRPHILLVMLVSSFIGFLFSSKGVSVAWRVLFLTGAMVVFFFIYKNVLTMVGVDEDELFTDSLNFSHRATELTKATSGVDIANYSLPMQVFTFLYRPLFVDAPGLLGLFVSFENVFYLLITLKLISSVSGWRFLFTGTFLSKSAIVSFLTVSLALAQISGNLGLAMRQKSQVMILLLFVVISYLDSEKMKSLKAREIARNRRLQQIQPVKKPF